MEILSRLTAPTPPFFQKVRNIGIVLLSAVYAVFELQIPLPPGVSDIAAGIAIAGAVMAGVGQAAVEKE
jgi:hypothetical protein